jgi:hypothetical protein
MDTWSLLYHSISTLFPLVPCTLVAGRTIMAMQCLFLFDVANRLIDIAVPGATPTSSCSYTTINMGSSALLLTACASGSCAFVVFFAYHLLAGCKTGGLPLPPGPRTSWLGGVHLPQTYQWLTYARWKDTFGLFM